MGALGRARNQGIIAQGDTIEFDSYFYSYNGGSLIDPSPDPTYLIKDPAGTIVKTTTTGIKQSEGIWHATYDVPIGGTLSSEWKIEWTAFVNGSQITDAYEYFQVIVPGSIGFGHQISMSTDWLNQVKIPLAFPKLEKFLLTDDEIKSLCVFPAIREYFTKFPIKVDYSQDILSNIELDFPDDQTFGVVNLQVMGKTGQSNSSSFWDIVNYQKYGMSEATAGMYGIKGYNPNSLQQQYYSKLQQVGTTQNAISTQDFRVYPHERKVQIYSSSSAKVQVTWAKYSLDFEDIKFERQMQVIYLCRANLLRHAADTSELIEDSSLEVTVNSDALKTKAEELREKVIEEWNEIPDVIYLRQT